MINWKEVNELMKMVWDDCPIIRRLRGRCPKCGRERILYGYGSGVVVCPKCDLK